jgi:hypothetical protein
LRRARSAAYGEQAVVRAAADGIGQPVAGRADGCLVTVGAVFWRAHRSASYHF